MTRDAAQRAAHLRERISYHDHRYHTLDAPEITDSQYDALMMELKQLEREHPELRDPNSPPNGPAARWPTTCPPCSTRSPC